MAAAGGGRRWLFVPYDQLSDAMGPLSKAAPGELGIVMIEAPSKAARRPYHRQKLALLLANPRHFALEQARRGVAVRYRVAPEHAQPYAAVLEAEAEELGPLVMMEAAERELRHELAPLVRAGKLELEAHAGWLTRREDFEASRSGGREGRPVWRMDKFYRALRKRTGLLMEGGKPMGGRWSLDADNRQPWRGEPRAPSPPRFELDPIKAEVCELVRTRFADHPGRLDPDALAATKDEAAAAWAWAKTNCLEHFGPYEDAMSRHEGGLFHTRISPLLNLHRLLPRRLVEDVLAMDIPLNSKEGFVRQVIGWREFVRWIHRASDGFRRYPDGEGRALERWGEAGPNQLEARNSLPAAYWSGASAKSEDGGAAWPPAPSGLACLDHVVDQVWREGWTHHIPRLMVLSNLANLLDVSPRELNHWFWVAYVDAFDWVVEPNVLGMGTFAAGDLMTTKPYISGAAYIDRMSDFCGDCRFHPKRSCPITPMYWAYLERNASRLEDNPRMARALASVAKRAPERKAHDARVFARVVSTLAEARSLDAELVAQAADEAQPT